MRRLMITALALALTACTAQAAPLEPCCPTLDHVEPAPAAVSNDRRAITRLIAANPGAALSSVRTIDQYQVVDLGSVGALLRNDTIVTVWEVR